MKRSLSVSRGQSEAVGVILLLGIMIIALSSLGALGANSFDNTKAGVGIEIVQQEMTTFAGAIEDVSFGDTPVKTVTLELDTAGPMGTTVVRESSGSIDVTVGGAPVYSDDLGVVEYENSGVRIAYQAGGVWREGAEGDVELVQAPPISVQNLSTSTLSMPIIVVEGEDGLSNGAVIESRGVQQEYPELIVPSEDTVVITIESRYYRAWARFFTDRLKIPAADVAIDDEANRTIISFGEGSEVYFHFTVYRIGISNR